MTTMNCALVVHRDAIPPVTDVVARLAEHGHAVGFPRGFEFTAGGRGPWIPITLDGARTGFDYALDPVASLADEVPATAASLSGRGSHVIAFGARGPESVRAVTAVMRAICELSGASGWVEEELIPADAMPQFLAGIAESNERLAAQLAAAPQQTKAEKDAAFKAFMAGKPRAQAGRSGLGMTAWICIWIGAGLVGWFLAT